MFDRHDPRTGRAATAIGCPVGVRRRGGSVRGRRAPPRVGPITAAQTGRWPTFPVLADHTWCSIRSTATSMNLGMAIDCTPVYTARGPYHLVADGDSVAVAGWSATTVFASGDAGATWAPLPRQFPMIHSLAIG